MRQFRFCALLLASLSPIAPATTLTAHAAEPVAAAPQPEQPASKDPVGDLFNNLKKERDAKKARGIATEIVGQWSDSGSPTINLLMQWAEEANEQKRSAAAYDFLDQAIFLDPDYAGAWYRRAMIHLADGDTRKAMADLNSTLEKEPRFFPALAGLANILESAERNETAMKVWERYLTLYPADKEAQKEMGELSEKLAGTRS
ncbi:tetratricopeptide repeat protein [Agrobacterium cavarae]|uniref:tetratricopeptide repeat protein n=1 Tax=Agrobacterium cavarae TaxID=2528239 RepID=UPI0028A59989|nr:tetratricopeptide repeat protein [Agrobacterium cavarae]